MAKILSPRLLFGRCPRMGGAAQLSRQFLEGGVGTKLGWGEDRGNGKFVPTIGGAPKKGFFSHSQFTKRGVSFICSRLRPTRPELKWEHEHLPFHDTGGRLQSEKSNYPLLLPLPIDAFLQHRHFPLFARLQYKIGRGNKADGFYYFATLVKIGFKQAFPIVSCTPSRIQNLLYFIHTFFGNIRTCSKFRQHFRGRSGVPCTSNKRPPPRWIAVKFWRDKLEEQKQTLFEDLRQGNEYRDRENYGEKMKMNYDRHFQVLYWTKIYIFKFSTEQRSTSSPYLYWEAPEQSG